MAKAQPVVTLAGTFKSTGPAATAPRGAKHPNVTVRSMAPSQKMPANSGQKKA